VDAGYASRDCNRARDRSCFETILELIDRHLLAAIDAGAALRITAGTTPPRLNLSLHPLLTGELDPHEAITSGRVRIEGNLLERFAEAFSRPAGAGRAGRRNSDHKCARTAANRVTVRRTATRVSLPAW
jgi:hypothetical protein